ncbi:65-kDa microtubule-associated protein 5-like protein [Corchorus olitorius]|uniref:65-kDa microtubule-associated protein 5-like protein n=1 Tax=Corchorus olitorius TaxID=93759 RepID=A0A1R3J2J9_9ROSI|nr:65-kDa microtubule-associated protein 5-like protein [Corchorus olitorius]
MAANTQQFGSREDYSREGNTRRINEVSTHSTSLEQQLQETNQQVAALTDLFNANFSSVPKSCGICKQGHYADKFILELNKSALLSAIFLFFVPASAVHGFPKPKTKFLDVT